MKTCASITDAASFRSALQKSKAVRATSSTPTDMSEVILDVCTTCSFAFQLRFNCYPIRLYGGASKEGGMSGDAERRVGKVGSGQVKKPAFVGGFGAF